MHQATLNPGSSGHPMAIRPIRFLPHILIGIAAFVALPGALHCADAPAVSPEPEEVEAGDEVPEKKEPGPAEVKFWSAIRLLASNEPGDIAQGRADMQAAADMEFSHAQLELGRYLLSGAYGFKKNQRKGANLFILAAERGNAYAQAAAGQCFYNGVGIRKNEEKAVRWLEAAIAANADYSRPQPPADFTGVSSQTKVAGAVFVDHAVSARANAQFLLARIEQGRKNIARAHEHCVAAAMAGVDGRDGHVDAARQAALNFAFGQGTERDPAKAREMLDHSRTLTKRQGAAWIQSWVQSKQLDEFATADIEEKFSTAGDELFDRMQYDIAKLFSDKKSKDYNPREAATWFEVAAESGQVWPMMHLAHLLGGNELGSPDPAAAFQWWLKAGGGTPTKHTLAAANLGICYLNGIGVEKDAAKAAEIFERHKHVSILCHLGTQDQAPTIVQTFEQSMKLLEAAAKKGDSHAQYLMGLRYRKGWDHVLDPDLAESWFKKAAKAKHAGAIRELGKLAERIPWGMRETPPKELKRAVDLYRQASDLGDAEATGNLALMHQLGHGTPKRPDVAENLYIRCLEIDPDFARAHNNLAIIYQDRLTGVVASGGGDAEALRASMLKSLEESARLGLAVASVNLGRLYSNGELVPQDHSKAYACFDDAAAAGVADAHFAMGIMHEKGLGVPVTYSEAAYHYRLAALEGHRQALNRLIDSYLSGRGVDVDWDMAAFWLLRAVEQGDTVSLIMFADVQLRRGNAKTAFDLFMRLWDHPNETMAGFACDRLSLCYEAGLGVKANPAKAKKYFDLAIQKGNGDALARLAQTHFASNRHAEGVAAMIRGAENSAIASYFLGQMYFFGTHVEQDQAKAMECMRKASQRNHPKALYFLAAATFNRVPEAPDIEEAIRFAESAEKLGLPEATSLREKLERRRDQAQEDTEQVARARAG